MSLQWTPFTTPLALSLTMSAVIGVLAWRRREMPGATPLALMMVALTAWSVAELGNTSVTELPAKVFWTRGEMVCSAVVPIAIVLFALEYSGWGERASRRLLASLSVEPIAFTAVVATASAPGLLRSHVGLRTVDGSVYIVESFGPVLWAHVTYSYALVLGSLLVLLVVTLSNQSFFRRQSLAVFTGLVVVFTGNAAYVFGITPPGLDLTNVAFTVTGGLLLVAISRRRLLDLVPVAREVARDETIENMTDGVVVLDSRGHVVDLNPAAMEIFDAAESVVGEPSTSVHPDIESIAEREAVADGGRTELTVRDGPTPRYYEVRVSPLRRGYGAVSGTLVTLQDVTVRRRREQRLAVQNRLLRHNVRNELNVVAGYVDLVADELADETLVGRLDTARSTAGRVVERCEKLGRVDASDAGPQRVDAVDVVARAVDAVAADEGPGGRVTVTETPDEAWIRADPALGAAFDELLANALDHAGDDPVVRVAVEREGPHVRVGVTDDGPGLPDAEVAAIRQGTETPLRHSSGVGLWLVSWVVERGGGELRFDPRPGENAVSLSLPAADSTEA